MQGILLPFDSPYKIAPGVTIGKLTHCISSHLFSSRFRVLSKASATMDRRYSCTNRETCFQFGDSHTPSGAGGDCWNGARNRRDKEEQKPKFAIAWLNNRLCWETMCHSAMSLGSPPATPVSEALIWLFHPSSQFRNKVLSARIWEVNLLPSEDAATPSYHRSCLSQLIHLASYTAAIRLHQGNGSLEGT